MDWLVDFSCFNIWHIEVLLICKECIFYQPFVWLLLEPWWRFCGSMCILHRYLWVMFDRFPWEQQENAKRKKSVSYCSISSSSWSHWMEWRNHCNATLAAWNGISCDWYYFGGYENVLVYHFCIQFFLVFERKSLFISSIILIFLIFSFPLFKGFFCMYCLGKDKKLLKSFAIRETLVIIGLSFIF